MRRAGNLASLGLAAVLAVSPLATTQAKADNITVENTFKGTKGTNIDPFRTRTIVNRGPMTLTYDANHTSDPEELKVWADLLSKNGWYVGFLGEADTKKERKTADFGFLATKNKGAVRYDALVLPIVDEKAEPTVVYQGAIRDSSGNQNLVVTVLDDRNEAFSLDNLDVRAYATGKVGNVIGGIGVNQKEGIESKTSNAFGTLGYVNDDFGTMTVAKYDRETDALWMKSQNALGNPSSGFYSVGTANLWADMQVGMRDIGTPYLSTFLGKGNITNQIEASIKPGEKNYEILFGKDFGVVRAGAGVNYNKTGAKEAFGALFHVSKDANLGKGTKVYAEGKHNTRTQDTQAFVRVAKTFK